MATTEPQSSATTPITTHEVSRRDLLKGAVAGAGALLLHGTGLDAPLNALPALAAPSPAQTPIYAIPSVDGVIIRQLLSVGEAAANGYRMVGIPDGLGAFMTGDTITLVMNHELRNNNGVTRAHGSRGAFVSAWNIERSTMRVASGRDLTPSPDHVHRWDPAAQAYTPGTIVWDRLCSADLAAESAFRAGGVGTTDRIFLNGDEVAGGWAWARIVTGSHAGEAWVLPRLGRSAFENVVANPHPQLQTIVMAMDDGALATAPVAADNPSQVYVYIGTKQADGHPIEQAGLTNGKLYGIRVYRNGALITEESNDCGLGSAGAGYLDTSRFDLVELGAGGDVSSLSMLEFEEDVIAHDVFRFQRPEDGAWDPRPEARGSFYFVTTASITSNSRLWHLQFDDLDHPEQGGTIEILLNATPGRMFDNITIDRIGRLLLQEDTGNEPHVAKVWLYGIDTGDFMEVASHDPDLFEPGGSAFITQDEESSGIIDAAHILGDGWFLFVVQAHYEHSDEELVEGGQLLAMYVPLELGRAM